MEAWTTMSKDPIDILLAAISAIGFPLTIYSIIISNRNTQRSIDVQIVTSLAIEFHRMWDSEWRALVSELQQSKQGESVPNARAYSLLNWIDWLGVLIARGAFKNVPLVMDTIGPSLLEAVSVTRHILNEQGAREWAGVFEIAQRLNALDNHGNIFLTATAQARLKMNYGYNAPLT